MRIKMVVPRSRTSVRYSRADAPAPAVADPELFADIARLSREAGDWLEKYEKERAAGVKLATAPAFPQPSAELEAVSTEARLAGLLGPSLTDALRRIHPDMPLVKWLMRFYGGDIDALDRELRQRKAEGVHFSMMAPKDATAQLLALEYKWR